MSAGAGQNASQDEEQIRQPVQVADRFRSYRIVARKRHHFAFGATANGAGQMAVAGRHAAARQDEILQRRQIGIERIQLLFEMVDVGIENGRVSRYAEFTAEIE